MVPINSLMNHIAEMSQAETFFTKHVSTRITALAFAAPCELLAGIENIIRLPFQFVGCISKYTCKTIDICFDSQTIHDFTDSQPGVTDLVKTALKVIGYAIGAVITATFGVLRPYDNFRLHAACHLIRNEKAIAEEFAAKQKADAETLEQNRALQAHIQNMVLAMRQKAIEREQMLAAQLKHQQNVVPQ